MRGNAEYVLLKLAQTAATLHRMDEVHVCLFK